MLSDEQNNFYKTNGYVLVKAVLTPEEAAHYREETHAIMSRLSSVSKHANDATWGSARDIAGGVATQVLHSHDVQFQSAAFARLIVDPRLTDIAADIMGTPNVQLHHTKAFIKPPEKGSPFPMHQDAPFFPHDHHTMIAAIVHFDDAPVEKGCVRVIPGSHKAGILPHIGEGNFHLDPTLYPVADAVPCPAEAGDVLFFTYMTIHGSGINTSDTARTTVLIQMRDPTDPPTIRTHESWGQGMMLRGIDPTCATLKPSSEVKNDTQPIGASMGSMGNMGGGMMGGSR